MKELCDQVDDSEYSKPWEPSTSTEPKQKTYDLQYRPSRSSYQTYAPSPARSYSSNNSSYGSTSSGYNSGFGNLSSGYSSSRDYGNASSGYGSASSGYASNSYPWQRQNYAPSISQLSENYIQRVYEQLPDFSVMQANVRSQDKPVS